MEASIKKNISIIPAKPAYDRSIRPQMRTLRVAAYCRVSTLMEQQESSYEAQVQYYTEKIKSNPNWKLAGIYADSLSKTLDCTVCITDTDQVIAAAGNGKKELQEMLLSAELAEVFQERKTVLKKSSDAEFVAITKDRSEYSEEIISVILSEGDIAGGVIFLQKNEKKHFGEMEKKFAAGAADLLGRQLS